MPKLRHFLAFAIAVACTDCADVRPSLETPTDLREYRLEIVRRIGSGDNVEDALTSIGQVVIGPDGRLFVSQPQDGRIRVYSKLGDLEGVIGRPGDGPGEFRSIHAMGFHGSSLFVADHVLGRVSFFTRSGQLLAAVPWSSESIRTSAGAYQPTPPAILLSDSTGLVVPNLLTFSTGDRRSTEAVRHQHTQLFLAIDRQGDILDTIAEWRYSYTSTGIPAGARAFRFACPFNDSPHYALMPNGQGVAMATTRREAQEDASEIVVGLIGLSRDTQLVASWPYQPVAVSSERVDAEAEEIHARRGVVPSPGIDLIVQAVQEHCVPEALPAITRLVSTQDGRIWIRREETDADSVTWNVVRPGRTDVMAFSLPGATTIVAASDSVVVATHLDSLDVPSLVVYGHR